MLFRNDVMSIYDNQCAAVCVCGAAISLASLVPPGAADSGARLKARLADVYER